MCVRTSTTSYGSFILDMGRSPGFGSTLSDSTRISHLVSLRLRSLNFLTSPDVVTRRTVLQKVRGCTCYCSQPIDSLALILLRGRLALSSNIVLPQLVNTGFQVLFHSPPGVLFTFPSQYYALSVTEEYLALGGGPPAFSQGSTCLDLLRIPPCLLIFRVRGFHSLWPAFPKPFH